MGQSSQRRVSIAQSRLSSVGPRAGHPDSHQQHQDREEQHPEIRLGTETVGLGENELKLSNQGRAAFMKSQGQQARCLEYEGAWIPKVIDLALDACSWRRKQVGAGKGLSWDPVTYAMLAAVPGGLHAVPATRPPTSCILKMLGSRV